MVATRSRTSREGSLEAEDPVKTQSSRASRQSSPAKSARSVSPKKRKQPQDEVKEKTVREQLKKTHVQEPTESVDSSDRGRPRRKRSFEEVGNEAADDATDPSKHKHVRKRSKSAEDGQEEDGFVLVDKPSTPPPTEPSDSAIASPALDSKAEPGTPPPKIPSTSGFANASITSPFANLGAGKSVFGASLQKSTKPDEPIAPIGFSTLANAAPWSATTKSDNPDSVKPSVFSSTSTSTGFGSLAGKPSVFGSSSGFGSTSGSAFGSTNGSSFGGTGAARLPTFSSGKGTFGSAPIEANRPSKGFGAPADGEDDEDDDGEEGEAAGDPETGVSLGAGADDLSQDDRFYEQEIETGEENETTVWQDKAKLYINENKQWKERCTGTLKVNTRKSSEISKEDAEAGQIKIAARFIMRSAASHKVLLNSPLTKDVMLEDPAKGPPKGRQAVFLGFVDGQPKMMLIKMRTESQIAALFDKLAEVQRDL